MNFEKTVIIIMVLFCAIIMAKVSRADTIPKCSMYEPYRCVPAYGNKIICGCGL